MDVSLVSLWLPILISALIVFVAAFLAWTVLPHHRSDFGSVRNDEPLLQALRSLGMTRGQYVFPWAVSPEGRQEDPEAAKRYDGPMGFLVVTDSRPNMTKQLIYYFLFCLGVSFMVGYIGYAAIDAGAEYLHVFRITGTVAFLAYSTAEIPKAIWFGQSWSATWKSVIDGLVFGLLTGGVFGWLWPS